MNKTQLIDELSSRFQGNKKAAGEALEAVVDTITRTVAKGEKVAITGFGVFEKIDRPARLARNPATGERVRVKKTSVPRFKAGTGFKDVVSGAKKLPKLTTTRVGGGRSAATTAKESAAKVTAAGRAAAGAARERVASRRKAAAAPEAKKAAPTKASTAGGTAKKATATKAAAPKTSAARKTATSSTRSATGSASKATRRSPS
jgi:DNA-binding protein HU-beta